MKAPRHIAAALSLLLAGCGTQLQQIKVPVPVACQAEEPTRPAMPTEALRPGTDIDRYVAASQAEIEIREGYELELKAALSECTAPLKK